MSFLVAVMSCYATFFALVTLVLLLTNAATRFRYFLLGASQTWDNAQAICRLNGGDLPTIKSERLDALVRQAIDNVADGAISSIWLGASNQNDNVRFF